MNGPWTGPDHLLGFEMAGPRITIRIMWPSGSRILITTDHQKTFEALLQQLPPTMAAVEHTEITIPTEEIGESKIEAIPSMPVKVLCPQKRYSDALHVTVVRLIYFAWVKRSVGKNFREGHDVDYLQIVTVTGTTC